MSRPGTIQLRRCLLPGAAALGVALVAMCGLGFAAGAAERSGAAAAEADASQGQPATQPATQSTTRTGDRARSDQRRGDGRDGRGPNGGGRPERREPTAEEWALTVDFLRRHAPRRLELYELSVREWYEKHAPPGANREGNLPRSIRESRAKIFGRVHMLTSVQEENPRYYDFALEQFGLEDQILGALLDAERADEAGNADAAAQARSAADATIRQFLQNMLSERERRIGWMKEELGREEQRLTRDRQNFDKIAEFMRERFERSLPGNDDEERSRRDGERRGESREGDKPE